jgi:DeoR family fructose operon transcriptional repressor
MPETGIALTAAQMKETAGSRLFAEERKERILVLLRENSKILAPELSEMFGVSQATVRGDLRSLEAEGKLRRTHGGAILPDRGGAGRNADRKEFARCEEMQRIAQAAALLIEDGDAIALDVGDATLELAKRLTDKNRLKIVTNDLRTASFLENNADADIVLIGGLVKRGCHCTAGPMTMAAFKEIHVDTAFLTTSAFSLEYGFTAPSIECAEIKKMLLAISTRRVMLMDSNIIGRNSFICFASPRGIDRLITDSGIDARAAAAIGAVSEMELQIV